jgi:hypothetical protein
MIHSPHRHHLQLYSCPSPHFHDLEDHGHFHGHNGSPSIFSNLFDKVLYTTFNTHPTTKHFLFIHKRIV